MTRKEAMAFAISTGKPIKHLMFSKGEYVKYIGKDKRLIDEDGITLPYDEFWSIRSGDYWEDGWSEYKS